MADTARSGHELSGSRAGEPYIGRFAPSPTGDLHLGSLVAALGSYLDARHHGGRWLLRMEDLDTPRVVPGCADRILRTLECFGLTWDGAVAYQSRNTEAYAATLADLRSKGRTFECNCSRRARMGDDQGYPGTCRDRPQSAVSARAPTATRFRIDERETVRVDDRFQGECLFEMRTLGDVIIRRRDGLFAYQLAVVVDDAAQGVNHVVRGADLLASTPWQMSLQAALGLPQPSYAHLPLVVEPDGAKLAKSRRSVPLAAERAAPLLVTALRLLGQQVPSRLEFETREAVLQWAVGHWNPRSFHGIRAVPAPAA
ncbi:MAG TPA: tRNA glutamyl-Q(34) synthetase GluQRS [Steroidobacteraceae bacterium]|nr:tRNA glutamyl-Q(34) synthetase GluQRS [Steroidobacteraceae bacterium]